MLSNHSFNALLKTLEEPPPHVKFLLATTDPQKLPVTVLSRCLQFNLKRLSSALIVERMQHICAAEGIKYEPSALVRIARAATGSMRDALSLLDQALAFGGGELQDADVADMLGSMDQRHIRELLGSVAAGDATTLIEQIRVLQELVPDYELVLDDLATVLQQVAVLQLAGADSLDEDADVEMLNEFATSLDGERVQLYYQIAITGRRDLYLAPDPRVGFEMTLLRMLAFQPAASVAAKTAGSAVPAAAVKSSPPAAASAPRSAAPVEAQAAASALPAEADWPTIIEALQLKGAVRQLAENSALQGRDDSEIRLTLSRKNELLLTDQIKKRLTDAVKATLGEKLRVSFTLVDDKLDTIAAQGADQSARRIEAARQAIENDPNVQELVDVFGAKVQPDSIRPAPDSGSNEA